MERYIRTALARILRLTPERIDISEAFTHYGFDSLMGLELRNQLQAALAIPLSMADILTHPRVDQLASFIHGKMALPTSGDASGSTHETSKEGSGQWVIVPRPVPSARMRLFCFPYAGGAAPVFSNWQQELPPEVELCAIQLPGRHERLQETPLRRVEDIVEALVPALLPYLDKPFAMLGHCLGAIIMFETLRVLTTQHKRKATIAFASAAPGPHRYLVPALSTLSDDEFADVLRSIGLANENVLVDRDAQTHFMPAVKADFDAAAHYSHDSTTPLDIPIVAMAGLSDPFAQVELVDEWRRVTGRQFTKITFPGGHYFIVPERKAVLSHVREHVLYRLAAEEQHISPRPPSVWIRDIQKAASTRWNVLIFPGLGMKADGLAEGILAANDNVNVSVVDLPGHGARASELPLGSVEDIAEHVARAMVTEPDNQVIFVGANLGALLAFHTATLMLRSGVSGLAGLVVADSMAPDVHYYAPVHHLPSTEFWERLQKSNLTPSDGGERALRAAYAALNAYSPRDLPRLNSEIVAIAKAEDPAVPFGGTRAWERHTSGLFRLEMLASGSGKAALINAIAQAVALQTKRS
ncbi:MAG: hypothetical protein IPK82_19365 [Polyangiaceae bacterium]|nr:hypothetical protein [Polyangiaceae bacterium]